MERQTSFTESQLELYQQAQTQMGMFQESMPDIVPVLSGFLDEVYKEGALSSKVKRLISMAVALRAGCTRCILSQTMKAIDGGATKAEIFEACAVAVAMGGTPAFAESARVMKLVEETGTK